MKKKRSLARLFTVLFILFALVTTVISGLMTYHSQTETYHAEVVSDLQKISSNLVGMMEKEGNYFSYLKAWFSEHPEDLQVPTDFRDDLPEVRQAFYEYMSTHYDGRIPGVSINVSELDREAMRLYMTWRFEYWFSVFLDATEEFKLSYIYFIYPQEGEDHKMIYLFDPSMENIVETEDGRQLIIFGDQVYEPLEEHAYMWRTWETGEEQYAVDSVDNEYGYMYTYCQPLVVDGEKVGLLCADTSVDHVTAEIRSGVKNQAFAAAIVLAISTVILYLLLRDRILRRIVRLEQNVEIYSENKDPAFADEIRKKSGPYDELGSLSERFADMIGALDEYMVGLQKITAEKERIGAELSVATQIQADMLPRIFPAFPDRNEFDIYASMTPAKEVGGDFYDFFLVDDNHLGVVMADVSGKGVPAALFMVIAKTLIKNRAQMGASPSDVLAYANSQLCEGNDAELFVTVWMAIIDISTGHGYAVNAGHEHPVIRRKDGKYELVIYRHSPAVATMEDLHFRQHEFQLNPGDSLFVYTDGVPEATDANNQLFGTDRMLDALNSARDGTPEDRLKSVKEAIDAFVGDAPQFDDITMLCLDYMGPEKEDSMLTLDAKLENLDTVLAFVDERLEGLACPMRKKMQIDVAVEEIFVNIVSYAYGPEGGTATIQVSTSENPDAVSVTFIDSGMPYNPLAKKDPDVTLPASKRKIGGLGIYMVKKSMDDVTYVYENNRNILTITKNLD